MVGMPRELVAVAPRKPMLQEFEEPALGADEIRIRSEFAAPKHGTELVGYRNEPAARSRYDPYWGCVIGGSDNESGRFPQRLGNMAVGVVTETGPAVTRLAVGQRVFGHLPIRETHTVEETKVDLLPDGLSAEAAVCLDPAVMAFGLRDAGIRLGDHVAIFGLGAIGLIAVQLARLAGADQVIAVDPIEPRRALATALGADAVIDPTADGRDPGMAIRKISGPESDGQQADPGGERVTGGYREAPTQVGQRGVDVGVEASGNPGALHQTIRATRFGGTICLLATYGGDSTGLRLGEEFHRNRLQIISSRVESLPLRDAPAWTLARIVDVTLNWILDGRIRTHGIITPTVDFDDAAEAYREIDEHPEQSIKLGIRFP